jgi:surface polysaccharide O-acyltransferase-like enzyme
MALRDEKNVTEGQDKIVMEKSARNSSFEVMRLLAMFMIVYEHCMQAVSLYTDNVLSKLDNISWLCESFTICSVNLFFLLTGYFATSRSFKVGKTAHMWGKTIFYSLVIYLLATAVGAESFTIKNVVSYACPIFTRKYWFMQAYIVLIILSPYIMTAVEQLTMKKHLTLICILLVFFSLHQTFIPVARTLDTTQGYGIIWAIVLLIVGNFINKWGNVAIEKIPTVSFLAGYVFIACCIFASNVVIIKFGIAKGVESRHNFYTYNSVTVLAESLCLFCFFVKLSMKGWSSRIVNKISASALAVYLIAAHPLLMESTWSRFFNMGKYTENPGVYFALAAVLSVVVMAVCIAIDMVVEFVIRKIDFLRKSRYNSQSMIKK